MSDDAQDDPGDDPRGFVFAILAYVSWGVLPIYLKAVDHMPAAEVVAHRVLWSVPVAGAVLWALGRTKEVRAALRPRALEALGGAQMEAQPRYGEDVLGALRRFRRVPEAPRLGRRRRATDARLQHHALGFGTLAHAGEHNEIGAAHRGKPALDAHRGRRVGTIENSASELALLGFVGRHRAAF